MSHPVDVHVGNRIRHRRFMTSTTQQQLADKVDVKFQQIQKYETGKNRVSASRLYDIAKALDTTPAWFFEGFEDRGTHPQDAALQREEDTRLRRAYEAGRILGSLTDAQRDAVLNMAKSLAETGSKA